jgi:HK97 family phage portal protein
VEQERTIGPPGDPLSLPPRSEVEPNANPPVGSVGPNVPVAGDPAAQEAASGGYGAQHVLYPASWPPLEAQAWAGWPSEWAVPNDQGGGLLGGLVGTDIVWACLDKNGSAIASMPPTASKDGIRLADQPAWLSNPQPEVYSHWAEFMRQTWWAYQSIGEVFIAATSRYLDSGYPRTFCMINPWFVSVDLVDGVRRYSIGGEDVTGDILHIRYASWPGDVRGHGPLEAAKERLLAAKVLMRYGSDLAANGGIPWAVLRHKFKLGAVQAEELRMQWVKAAHSRMGAPAVLDNDTELQQLQTTPKDMALSELQQFAEARLAVLLGVPPFLVGLPSGGDSLTYANVSMIYDAHWRETLRPHSAYIMGALSAWALPGRTAVELDAEAYIRPAPVDRATYYKVMVEIGAMTPDEVRQAERLPARLETAA